MHDKLSREQIVDLLNYLGVNKIRDYGKDDIQFCCPIHGENTPSAGVSIEKQVFNCFSCHAHGSIAWLVYETLDEMRNLRQSEEFLENRYGISVKRLIFKGNDLKRYEDQFRVITKKSERFILPRTSIAPFKSGKETFQYFFDRGYTKDTVKRFLVGRDLVNETVTVPCLWEDEQIAGVVGRYIDPDRRKNERFKIYYNSPTGEFLFPLNKFKPIDGVGILVEGLFTALRMHEYGYTNTLATLTNSMTDIQGNICRSKCKRWIDLSDNDERGEIATKMYKEKLGKSVIFYSDKSYYPDREGVDDADKMTKKEVDNMIENVLSSKKKIRRYF